MGYEGAYAAHPPDRLLPTLRFDANSAGIVDSWQHTNTIDNAECDPFRQQRTPLGSQPLRGRLLTAISTTDGLRFNSERLSC